MGYTFMELFRQLLYFYKKTPGIHLWTPGVFGWVLLYYIKVEET